MDCSTYCSVLPAKIGRCGSAWKKHAEMPMRGRSLIRGLKSERLLEEAREVRARTRPRIGLVADVLLGDVHHRRDLLLLHADRRQRRRDSDCAFQVAEPANE